MSSAGHEWTKHERDGWSVCSRCGMVRNYDRELTTCSGALPKIRQRSEIEDCGQDGVCRLSPGCNRHWEERNRELVRERDAAIARAEQAERERDELEARVQELEAALRAIAAIDSASPEHRIAMRVLGDSPAVMDTPDPPPSPATNELTHVIDALRNEAERLADVAEEYRREGLTGHVTVTYESVQSFREVADWLESRDGQHAVQRVRDLERECDAALARVAELKEALRELRDAVDVADFEVDDDGRIDRALDRASKALRASPSASAPYIHSTGCLASPEEPTDE